MVDYYRILKVSPKASNTEIKSAYRKLARKMHPDVNGGSESAARDFSQIAKAYQILSNPQERAYYDAQLLKARNNIGDSDSVIFSENPHARRLRRMAIQRRMDAVVDRLIERERMETQALQQAVFPVVALFLSTFFVGMLKPQFWSHSDLLGKSIVLALFVAGTWHLFRRLRTGYERYTRSDTNRLHDSVLREEEEEKPFSRLAATAFLCGGIVVSLGFGFLVGKYLEIIITNMMGNLFAANLHFELIFYPPIAVLIVDTMHTVASKADL
ncbi:MAG TPA: J domain-containing protein [Pyrinomonadaceae bacterium]|nr:J domain-containing protein [Pyrinomonadaceae bacterium]